jgi:hypothetical protein
MGLLIFLLILVLLALAGILGFVIKVALGVALGVFLGALLVGAIFMWRVRRFFRRGPTQWRRISGSSTIDVPDPKDRT